MIEALKKINKYYPKVTKSECGIKNKLVRYNCLVYILDDKRLRCEIKSFHHKYLSIGHLGHATINLLYKILSDPEYRN
jgi:hypothetical protein